MSAGRARLGPVLIAWRAASVTERFDAGRALLGELVRELTGAAEVEIFRHCPRCGSDDHGPPQVRGLPVAVSVSYAGEMVAVAAVRVMDAAAVGIDIEADGSAHRVEELGPLFAPHPVPDLRGWTLVEAALKADGRGLNVDPSTVRLDSAADTILGEGFAASRPDDAAPVTAAAAPGPEGFVLSVAVRAPGAAGSPAASAAAARPARR